MGGALREGMIEYFHPPNTEGTRVDWNVQVNVGGITWLGTPDKVQVIPRETPVLCSRCGYASGSASCYDECGVGR